jgi:LacI family transcriptional regulator
LIKPTSVPTLVDVAREAGVSLKTASRALNNSPELRPETAARVLSAMTKLGYRANELARGLKAKRSSAIGMVVPNLADPFTASAVKAVQEVARTHGYVVILTSSDGDEQTEQMEVESLIRRQVDGLIIAPAIGDNSLFHQLASTGIHLVVFDQPIDEVGVDCVVVNNEESSRLAVEHLLGHGYTNILAAGARPGLYTCAQRISGYRRAMSDRHLPESTMFVEHESLLNARNLNAFIEVQGLPDAIFALNYVASIRMLRAMRELRIQIGVDVAFVSFDDFELADMLSTSLTVIRQPIEEMGRSAASLLFRRINGSGRIPRKKVVLPTSFHPRSSCGCLSREFLGV